MRKAAVLAALCTQVVQAFSPNVWPGRAVQNVPVATVGRLKNIRNIRMQAWDNDSKTDRRAMILKSAAAVSISNSIIIHLILAANYLELTCRKKVNLYTN